jgi:hypothetical protein
MEEVPARVRWQWRRRLPVGANDAVGVEYGSPTEGGKGMCRSGGDWASQHTLFSALPFPTAVAAQARANFIYPR